MFSSEEVKGKDWKLTRVWSCCGRSANREASVSLLTPLPPGLPKPSLSLGITGGARSLHFCLPEPMNFQRPGSRLCSPAMASWSPSLPQLALPLSKWSETQGSQEQL